MSGNEDVQRAIDSAVESVVARLKSDLATQLFDSIVPALPAPAPPAVSAAPGGTDAAELRTHLFSLLDGTGQVEILNRLMGTLSSYWERSVLYLNKGVQFQPWDTRGFEGGVGNAAAKAFAVSATADTILAAAIAGHGAQAQNGLLAQGLGAPKGPAAAVPLGIRNKAAAVLYCDGPKMDLAGAVAVMEVLARVTASSVELSMLTKRTEPFVRTEAVTHQPGGAAMPSSAAAPAAAPKPAPAPAAWAAPTPVVAPVPPPRPVPPPAPAAFTPPAPAPPAPVPVRPVPPRAPEPEPAPEIEMEMEVDEAPATVQFQMPAPLPAAPPAPPKPSAFVAPAPAPPAPAPPAPSAPAAEASAPPVDLAKELSKAGAKPVVDAGQSFDSSKKFSRWKPIRDQMKAGEGLDESLASIPEGERAKHVEAKKIARLLVSEIKLYNEAKVAVGRKNKDLYERLKEDIERSRASYMDRVGQEIAAKTTYFRDELVQTLAEGDAEALGKTG